MKIRFFILLFTLVALNLLGAETNVIRQVQNRYQGKLYEFVVTQSAVDAAPAWGGKEENPPLSARSALNKAREYAKRSVPDSGAWTVNRILLEPAGQKPDRWLYLVEFMAFGSDAQFLLGAGRFFGVPVLMDGTVVTPKVTTVKDAK